MPPMYVRWSPQWSAKDSWENPLFCRNSLIRAPSAFCSSCTFNRLRVPGLDVYRLLEDSIDIAYSCFERRCCSGYTSSELRRRRWRGRLALPGLGLYALPFQSHGIVQGDPGILVINPRKRPGPPWRDSICSPAHMVWQPDISSVNGHNLLRKEAASTSRLRHHQRDRQEH